MSLGIIFWILMLFWLVFGVWQNWPNRAAFAGWGSGLGDLRSPDQRLRA